MRLRVSVLAAGVLCIVFVTRTFADVCNPSDPRLLMPELAAQPPSEVRVLTGARQRQLSFTTMVGNVGDGPLIVHGQTIDTSNGKGTQVTQEVQRADGTSCTHVVGFFPFGSGGEQFHIDDFAEYQLRSGDPFAGPVVARWSAVSTCLADDMRLWGFRGAPAFRGCAVRNDTQGVSVGFASVTDAFSPGQSLNLDADPAHPVLAGDYFLVIVVNPNGALLEKTNDPNADGGVVSVSIPATQRWRPPHMSRPSAHRPRSTPPVVPTPSPTASPTPQSPPLLAHPSRPPRILPPGHEGCGGIRGTLCSRGEFCQYLWCPRAQDTGFCTPFNQECVSAAVAPVCGCDGVTYKNDCERIRAGVSPAHRGPC